MLQENELVASHATGCAEKNNLQSYIRWISKQTMHANNLHAAINGRPRAGGQASGRAGGRVGGRAGERAVERVRRTEEREGERTSSINTTSREERQRERCLKKTYEIEGEANEAGRDRRWTATGSAQIKMLGTSRKTLARLLMFVQAGRFDPLQDSLDEPLLRPR